MSQGLGWVKMNGKKSKVLSCGCCVAEDHRDELLWKAAANEIRFSPTSEYGTPAEYAWQDEVEASYDAHYAVDALTRAKYTWGAGLSVPRIEAILAQERADLLKRVADRFDALCIDAA
jgi:hypothetical protein